MKKVEFIQDSIQKKPKKRPKKKKRSQDKKKGQMDKMFKEIKSKITKVSTKGPKLSNISYIIVIKKFFWLYHLQTYDSILTFKNYA